MILCAALVAATLAGCAGVKTDVQASPLSGTFASERTYALVRTEPQDANAGHAQYEALVRAELARYGFVEAPKESARYHVSLAYDTRPAGVGVDAAGCGSSTEPCSKPAPSTTFFGQRLYQHSLTVRFFDRTNGQEIYKVAATKRDREADPLRAVPYLVQSVLAQMPYAGHQDWQVTFKGEEAGEDQGQVSGIKSIKPVEP